MRDDQTGFLIALPPGHSLHDREVVLHLAEAAILRKPIKKRANRICGRHQKHRAGEKRPPEYELGDQPSTSIDASPDQ